MDAEDGSAVVAVVSVLTVYSVCHCFHLSARTAAGGGSGCLLFDFGGNYAVQGFFGTEGDAFEILWNLIAATQGQCCAGLEYSAFEVIDNPAVSSGNCSTPGCYL